MRQLKTLAGPDDGRLEVHSLELPQCCPVSKNPFPGSNIKICYRPRRLVLEVAALKAYINQFRGGLKDDSGAIVVRDMEAMISRIAQDCASAAGVPVTVCADLAIMPRQSMYILVRRQAEE